MFGYVKTDFPNLYVKDVTLYKAMYCGLCKGIGKTCGQRGRLVLNYDLTFLSVFLHNLLGIDVKIEKQKCIIHHITKRPVAIPDELTFKIASLNIILARYKLNDDVSDEKKGRLMRAFLAKAYRKAKKAEPDLDKIVKESYSELLSYEKTNGDSIDMSADPFGKMMQNVVKYLMKDQACEEALAIAYNLGKWIYLIDALDDFDKDLKRKSFNVFINSNPNIKNKEEFIEKKKEELVGIFGTILSDIANLSFSLKYKFNHDLLDNVLLLGLKNQTKNILENQKCKNTTKF